MSPPPTILTLIVAAFLMAAAMFAIGQILPIVEPVDIFRDILTTDRFLPLLYHLLCRRHSGLPQQLAGGYAGKNAALLEMVLAWVDRIPAGFHHYHRRFGNRN